MVPRIAVALGLMLAGAGVLTRQALATGSMRFQAESTETPDDLLVRVEARAPGFGGMFIDSDGRLAVYLLDAAQLPAARAAIEAVFGSSRVPAAGVRAVQGQYRVSELKAWTERAGALLGRPGVTMIDLDEAKNRVRVGVESDTRMRGVEQALSSLGVPRKAVVIQVTGQIKPVAPR